MFADPGPAAGHAYDHSGGAQLFVGLYDRAAVDSELLRQLSLGRQETAGRELAERDALFDMFGNLKIQRFLVISIRFPQSAAPPL